MHTIDRRRVDSGSHQSRAVRIGRDARPLADTALLTARFVPHAHGHGLTTATGAQAEWVLRECDLHDLPAGAADAVREALHLVQDRLERLTISHD